MRCAQLHAFKNISLSVKIILHEGENACLVHQILKILLTNGRRLMGLYLDICEELQDFLGTETTGAIAIHLQKNSKSLKSSRKDV